MNLLQADRATLGVDLFPADPFPAASGFLTFPLMDGASVLDGTGFRLWGVDCPTVEARGGPTALLSGRIYNTTASCSLFELKYKQ